jgi:hypothetical protein
MVVRYPAIAAHQVSNFVRHAVVVTAYDWQRLHGNKRHVSQNGRIQILGLQTCQIPYQLR